jgi:hypothetical protein
MGAALSCWTACRPSCDPGYDDQYVTTYACDGNVSTGTRSACGQTKKLPPVDCSATNQTCIASRGTCATLCAHDSDCAPSGYCSATALAGGPPICVAPLLKGADCTGQPTHCDQGLVCAVEGGAGDAGANASDGGDAGANARMTCQENCTGITASAQCPTEDATVCVGNAKMTCHCFVPQTTLGTCDPGTFCVLPQKNATDFAAPPPLCALAQAPDPKCPNTNDSSSYCDGDARVFCDHGYSTTRTPCPSSQHCTQDSIGALCQ